MPTYQYQCTDCGEALEVVQAFTDDSLTECPACGGRLRKLFNAVGIVFKGSGFYRTDSRSGSSSSVGGSSSSSSSSGDTGSSTSTSSTPASAAGAPAASGSSGSSGSGSSGSSGSAA